MRIFVYEDEKNIAELLGYYLGEELKHKVSLCITEREALKNIGVSHFDYYLLCHNYHNDLDCLIDGLEKEKVIILTTGFVKLSIDKIRSYKVLQKPFSLEDLDRLIV